ncbi:hypothetical protein Tco_0552390, partial [Tanacetum coccineum]
MGRDMRIVVFDLEKETVVNGDMVDAQCIPSALIFYAFKP